MAFTAPIHITVKCPAVMADILMPPRRTPFGGPPPKKRPTGRTRQEADKHPPKSKGKPPKEDPKKDNGEDSK